MDFRPGISRKLTAASRRSGTSSKSRPSHQTRPGQRSTQSRNGRSRPRGEISALVVVDPPRGPRTNSIPIEERVEEDLRRGSLFPSVDTTSRGRKSSGAGLRRKRDSDPREQQPKRMKSKRAQRIPISPQRRGLPITFSQLKGPATVISCPDSASEVNAISLDLAELLGLNIESEDEKRRTKISMANGKTMEAYGRIATICTPDNVSGADPPNFPITLHVFKSLAEPELIMGRRFLENSETLSKHVDRLVLRWRPTPLAVPSIRSIGSPSQFLQCCLDGMPTQVIADSGSEVNLMKTCFVQKRGFSIHSGSTTIQYADGSTAKTSGVVYAEIAVGKDAPHYRLWDRLLCSSGWVQSSLDNTTQEASKWKELEPPLPNRLPEDVRRVVRLEFHITPDLTTDVLIGEDSLAALEPHRLNQDEFVSGDQVGTSPPHINRIVKVSELRQKTEALGRRYWDRLRNRGASIPTNTVSASQNTISCSADLDQIENAHRDKEDERIKGLPKSEQPRARSKERKRRKTYDIERQQRQNHTQPSNAASGSNT